MDESSGSASRRRRGAGIVTPNACTECRKKRAKCDGQVPCGRCQIQSTECVYEIPVRQSKETMRAEIEQLQNHRRQSERILGALVSHKRINEILNRIRNGETIQQVADWLDRESAKGKTSSQRTTYNSAAYHDSISSTLKMAESVTHSLEKDLYDLSGSSSGQFTTPSQGKDSAGGKEVDAMNWQSDGDDRERSQSFTLSRPLVGSWPQEAERDTFNDSNQSARGRGQDHILGSTYGPRDDSTRPRGGSSTWTSVTTNSDLVEHLLTLYFCWEYPTFASLSKEQFLEDFWDGNTRYCSSLLVNAMLALGCRFSNLPESCAEPGNRETSGDHFFAEAKRLYVEDDHTSLTSIQALGLISIREASCGRDTESYFYAGQAIRLAVEYGLHTEAANKEPIAGDDTEHEVRSATFWGAFALDQAWSLCLGRVPQLSRTARFSAKPAVVESIESSEWVPYSDKGSPLIKEASQPSNVRSVFRCFAELSELVHQSLYALHSPERTLTSNEVISVYFRYINWYSSLPEALRLGRNFTPAVLFCHMYYHFAVLLLLRPFIKLRFLGSGVNPQELCIQAANAITTLLRSYDQLYTLQRTPSFVPYIVLGACLMHLSNGTSSPANVQHIQQGANDLKDMISCHGFAKRGLDIMRYFAHIWEVPMGEDEMDDETFARLSEVCGPDSNSHNLFCPHMGEGSSNLGSPNSLALFAPFPMQGMPLMAKGDEFLARDGFERIE